MQQPSPVHPPVNPSTGRLYCVPTHPSSPLPKSTHPAPSTAHPLAPLSPPPLCSRDLSPLIASAVAHRAMAEAADSTALDKIGQLPVKFARSFASASLEPGRPALPSTPGTTPARPVSAPLPAPFNAAVPGSEFAAAPAAAASATPAASRLCCTSAPRHCRRTAARMTACGGYSQSTRHRWLFKMVKWSKLSNAGVSPLALNAMLARPPLSPQLPVQLIPRSVIEDIRNLLLKSR
jgi:hypothetical protein